MRALPDHVSSIVFGGLVSLTPRRVQQLVAEGILPTDGHGKMPFKAAVAAFIAWRVKSETERLAPKEDPIEAEKLRRIRNENDERERLLIRTDDAIAAIDAIIGPLVADLSAVPARVTDDIVVRRKIEDEINAVRSAGAKRFRQAGTDLRSGRDPLAAPAEDDAVGLGEEI